MKKKILSFIVLFLTLLNVPTILLFTSSVSISSPFSYLLFFLLGCLIISNKEKYSQTLKLLAITSLLYFVISLLRNQEEFSIFLVTFIKFMIYIFGLYIAIKFINKKTIIIFLLIGAFTIILDSLYFRFNDFQGFGYVAEYGRYSGFYLNPNTAAQVCLVGYALTITKSNRWRLLAVFFTLFGFLTLSRTFIITWIIISFTYLLFHKKQLIKGFIIGGFAILGLINFSEYLKLDITRFNFFIDLFSGKIDTQILSDDSRQDQWAKFYNMIYESPIIGNGFGSFSSSTSDIFGQGVHNTFLLILGESGFLPFILIIIFFIIITVKCYNLRKYDLSYLLLILMIFFQFLVNHNFFSSGIMIFVITYLLQNLNQIKKQKLIM